MRRLYICILATLMAVSAVCAGRIDVEQRGTAKVLVRVLCDGKERHLQTPRSSVGAVLEQAGIKLGSHDTVSPSLDTKPEQGMTVRVARVLTMTVVERLPIGYETVRKPSPDLRPGLTVIKSEGSRGEKLVYYSARYENGVEVSRTKLRSELITPPKDRIILIGQDGVYTSRGMISPRRTLRMHATAYDPGPRSCGRYANGYTSCGMRAGYGVVAVDPRVISLGSNLYVEGYGFATAGDTGRAIKGNRIDLGFNTYRAAMQFGRRYVTVHILK